MITDLTAREPGSHIARLRYSNLVDVHPSGRSGEDPYGISINLLPFVSAGVRREGEQAQVFWADQQLTLNLGSGQGK